MEKKRSNSGYNDVFHVISETRHRAEPDDVGCCFPLLGQQLWVVHNFFQEGNDLRLQLIVALKVLEMQTVHVTD